MSVNFTISAATESNALATLLLVTVLAHGAVYAATPSIFDPEFDLVFERITIDNGLPENSVRTIIQDQHGFVWLGTQNGLVRYDGYEMLVHAPDPGDSTSFGGRTVDALFEDPDGPRPVILAHVLGPSGERLLEPRGDGVGGVPGRR